MLEDLEHRFPEFKAGESETHIMYCQNERIEPGNTMPRWPFAQYFSPELQCMWRLHYAREYPHLASSKEIMRSEGKVRVLLLI